MTTAQPSVAMNPGRELDALVAGKVMGWKRLDLGPINGIRWKKGNRMIESEHPFSYSTDISAAWEVVEKFECLYLFRCVSGPFEGKYECKLVFEEGPDNDKRRFYAVAETAPLAICRAGLRTVAQK